jgi:hypothetical protein
MSATTRRLYLATPPIWTLEPVGRQHRFAHHPGQQPVALPTHPVHLPQTVSGLKVPDGEKVVGRGGVEVGRASGIDGYRHRILKTRNGKRFGGGRVRPHASAVWRRSRHPVGYRRYGRSDAPSDPSRRGPVVRSGSRPERATPHAQGPGHHVSGDTQSGGGRMPVSANGSPGASGRVRARGPHHAGDRAAGRPHGTRPAPA